MPVCLKLMTPSGVTSFFFCYGFSIFWLYAFALALPDALLTVIFANLLKNIFQRPCGLLLPLISTPAPFMAVQEPRFASRLADLNRGQRVTAAPPLPAYAPRFTARLILFARFPARRRRFLWFRRRFLLTSKYTVFSVMLDHCVVQFKLRYSRLFIRCKR